MRSEKRTEKETKGEYAQTVLKVFQTLFNFKTRTSIFFVQDKYRKRETFLKKTAFVKTYPVDFIKVGGLEVNEKCYVQ